MTTDLIPKLEKYEYKGLLNSLMLAFDALKKKICLFVYIWHFQCLREGKNRPHTHRFVLGKWLPWY